jgi:hypothetical protein
MAMKISQSKIREIDSIKDHDSKMLAAAVMYAEEGFYVMPVRRNHKAIPGKTHSINYAHASNNPKTVSKWYGPEGKFEGWNIGLATGRENGIFVVDLDRHGDKNGLDSFGAIVPDGWEFRGPIQNTPSGGKHLLFNWRDHLDSTTGRLGTGIDTRGGKERDKCSAHIVAWPSAIDGDVYEWERGGEVEATPEWLIEKMGKSGALGLVEGTGRGNENTTEADLEDKVTLETIAKMLDVMNPEEYGHDEWCNIGMAIHSQHPEEGLNLWDEWSSKDERADHKGKPMYDRGLIKAKWSSFSEEGSIRIGTLFHYAKQAGFDMASLKTVDDDVLIEVVRKMNERWAVVPMGGKTMVYEKVEVPPEFAAFQSQWRMWNRHEFKAYFENKYEVAVDKHGKPVQKSHADIWLAHPDRTEYDAGPGLFPGKPQRYRGHLNMWQGFSRIPAPGDWSLFKDHILNIVCNGNEEHYQWLLDWMADLFQDPANPKGCAVVMHGVEGCGKGTFAQMIGIPFGIHFKHVNDEEHLVGRFNHHLSDGVLVFADEVVYGGNHKVAGKLKALVTERIVMSERKGVDPIQYQNCAHLMVASNEDWFIPAGPQSRRWFVLDFSPDRANDRPYFNAIHTQMEKEGGIEAMMDELLQREITHDLQKAPETKMLQEQRSMYVGMNSLVAWYFNCVTMENLNCPPLRASDDDEQWLTEVSCDDILGSYSAWCKERPKLYEKSAQQVFKFLLNMGFVRTRFTVAGKRIRGYKVPPIEQAIEFAKREGYNPDEEIYEDED